MSRLPATDRAKLAPEDQATWDRILAGRSGAAMRGPFAALIQKPALAERVSALEDYFRTAAELPAADRELVILTTAREFGAHFPWARHEARGRQEGTRSEAIETLRGLGSLDGLTARERLLVEVTRTLLRTHGLPDDLYARAVAELGNGPLVEIIALIGNYSLVGMIANTYQIPEESKTF
jgi:4-carboxymuconolactone decarboxylase